MKKDFYAMIKINGHLRIKYKLTNKRLFGVMDSFLSSSVSYHDKKRILYDEFNDSEYFE